MPKRKELLAPCSDIDAVKIAVQNGADAVYLGLTNFSARKNAKNLTIDELDLAVKFCHQNGVLLYLALNTLIIDREFSLIIETIKAVCAIPVDAIIVQDLGLIYLLRQLCPTMPLHASTQMSIHTQMGVNVVKALGLVRVVLAREMSSDMIAKIKNIETEIFVHGALCMSVSGQCYFSSFLGERSGNRGDCASPCRLPDISGKYPLSLKDLSLIDNIYNIDATSLKIEGRLKSSDYVAGVTSNFRSVLDGHSSQISSKNYNASYFSDTLTQNLFGRVQDTNIKPTPTTNNKNPIDVQAKPIEEFSLLKMKPCKRSKTITPKLIAYFEKSSQICKISDLSMIILPIDEVKNVSLGDKLIVALPRFKIDEDSIIAKLKAYRVDKIYAQNLSDIAIAKEIGATIYGGEFLNVTNSYALLQLQELNLSAQTVSIELNYRQIEDLQHKIPIGMVAYGYIPLMLTRVCPAANKYACKTCNHILKDRTGTNFHLQCYKDYSEVLNSIPLYLADKELALDYILLRFSIEDKAECARIITAYMTKQKPPVHFTRGHYAKGIKKL